jgi:hypothetical protein
VRAEERQARVTKKYAVGFLELQKPVLPEQRPYRNLRRNLRATPTQPVRRSPMQHQLPSGA